MLAWVKTLFYLQRCYSNPNFFFNSSKSDLKGANCPFPYSPSSLPTKRPLSLYNCFSVIIIYLFQYAYYIHVANMYLACIILTRDFNAAKKEWLQCGWIAVTYIYIYYRYIYYRLHIFNKNNYNGFCLIW